MPAGDLGHWVNIDGFNFENTMDIQPTICDTNLRIMASSSKITKGFPVVLTVSGGCQYSWLSNEGFIKETGHEITITPQSSSTYTVISKRDGCPDIKATIFIEVVEPDKPKELKPDTVLKEERFVKFTKHHLNGRKYKVQQTLNAESKTVKINIYDKNRVDGDIVSIYLNGKLIVENIQVTHQKKEISLQLQNGSNVLVMYAINLGRIPPNTAALEINNGNKRNRVTTLVSDFKNSGALELIYNDDVLSMR
jgi:hypothetical protein